MEALWSQFEGVMGQKGEGGGHGNARGEDAGAGAAGEEEKESALETPPVVRTR